MLQMGAVKLHNRSEPVVCMYIFMYMRACVTRAIDYYVCIYVCVGETGNRV